MTVSSPWSLPLDAFADAAGTLLATILYGRIDIDDPSLVPQVAASALAEGADSEHLRLLAGLSANANRFDLADLLRDVADELYPAVPGGELAARWLLLEYWLLCLLRSSGSPSVVLQLIHTEGFVFEEGGRIPKDAQSLYAILDDLERDPTLEVGDRVAATARSVLALRFPSSPLVEQAPPRSVHFLPPARTALWAMNNPAASSSDS